MLLGTPRPSKPELRGLLACVSYWLMAKEVKKVINGAPGLGRDWPGNTSGQITQHYEQLRATTSNYALTYPMRHPCVAPALPLRCPCVALRCPALPCVALASLWLPLRYPALPLRLSGYLCVTLRCPALPLRCPALPLRLCGYLCVYRCLSRGHFSSRPRLKLSAHNRLYVHH
jgi:hypothetical protein